MTIAGRIKGLVSYYRQGGLFEVLARLSERRYVPSRLFSLSACHIFGLGAINARSLARPLHGYRFDRATRDALDELMACQKGQRWQTSRAFLANLFDSGNECFVTRFNGEVVAFFWTFRGSYRLHFDAHPKHELTIILRENDVFFGVGFIAPDHRLRGVFPHLYNFVTAQYPGARCFSMVALTNVGSLKAHHRFGFVRLLTVACLDVCSLRVFYRRPDAVGPGALLGFGSATIDIEDCLRTPISLSVNAPKPPLGAS